MSKVTRKLMKGEQCLWGANLTGANLAAADFSFADLGSGVLADAILTGTDFYNATMPNGTLHE